MFGARLKVVPELRVDAQFVSRLARRLVQTPSVNPMGDAVKVRTHNEEAVASLLLLELARLGVPARQVMVAEHRPMVLARGGRAHASLNHRTLSEEGCTFPARSRWAPLAAER
jgi:hypothetical protein